MASTYRERLMPAWWAWLLAALLGVMLGVAYGAALGGTAGWIAGSATVVVLLLVIWTTSPTIAVEDGELRAAGARLPAASIAAVEPVTAADIARLRGPGSDARLFVSLRPWSGPSGVLVTLDDPDDPHPAWLLTSRHPSRLTEAITATMGTRPDPEDA